MPRSRWRNGLWTSSDKTPGGEWFMKSAPPLPDLDQASLGISPRERFACSESRGGTHRLCINLAASACQRYFQLAQIEHWR